MFRIKYLALILFIFTMAAFFSTSAISQTPEKQTYEKQKVEKQEKDEGRYQQLKKDADLRGRTEENKGNFDTDVPRGDGIERPPAKNPSN